MSIGCSAVDGADGTKRTLCGIHALTALRTSGDRAVPIEVLAADIVLSMNAGGIQA